MKHHTKSQKRERWRKVGKVAMWVAAAAGAWELYLATVLRKQRLRDTFNLALQRAQATGKKLVVIGDPHGRLLARTLGPDWDCAGNCTDIPNLVGLGANSSVVFLAFELERTEDARSAVAQLQRVSGGDLFVAGTEPYSFLAWLPGQKRRVLTAPPKTPYIEIKALPWTGGGDKERLLGRVA
jgi:hypothetical protein